MSYALGIQRSDQKRDKSENQKLGKIHIIRVSTGTMYKVVTSLNFQKKIMKQTRFRNYHSPKFTHICIYIYKIAPSL